MQLKDFIQIEIQDNIGICWIDNKLEKMNIVSPPVIALFEELMPLLEDDDRIKAVVFISRKPDFMAGADIKSFEINSYRNTRIVHSYVIKVDLNWRSTSLSKTSANISRKRPSYTFRMVFFVDKYSG